MLFLFFFFKQKTAYEMRISDWSSDVCSSDLSIRPRSDAQGRGGGGGRQRGTSHRSAASSSSVRASTQRRPPSASSSSFQNGALVLSQSIRNAQASSAAARWLLETATSTIRAPGSKIGRASCREGVCPYV